MDIFSWAMMEWQSGIEFSWDMSLREFIIWALDQPFVSYVFIILMILCLKILYKFIVYELDKK